MSYEIRADYQEQWLFPPSLEELVPADHPARFIRDFVDALDLAADGFRVGAVSGEGRPRYAADLLLKVWVYGYLQDVRSSRRLERACREHLSLLWLTGRHEPDHNTLWRFWSENRAALRAVFTRVVQVAVRANLVGLVLHAVDGTKIAAQASKRPVWNRQRLEAVLGELDTTIETMMQEVETAESIEVGEYRLPRGWCEAVVRREELRELLQELEISERPVVHPTEREARLMKSRQGEATLGYNAQLVVDRDSELIVAHEVTPEATDHHQLVPMLERVEQTLGSVAETTVADGGYYAPQALQQAEERGYAVLVNEGAHRAPPEGTPGTEFHAARFTYEAQKDCCICPRGEELSFAGWRQAAGRHGAGRVYRCRSFRQCPVRWQCSREEKGRVIVIGEHHGAIVAHRARLQRAENQQRLQQRKAIVEAPFGGIKEAHGFRRWTVRGLEGVRTQWAMICTACNLRKLLPAWRAGVLLLT